LEESEEDFEKMFERPEIELEPTQIQPPIKEVSSFNSLKENLL